MTAPRDPRDEQTVVGGEPRRTYWEQNTVTTATAAPVSDTGVTISGVILTVFGVLVTLVGVLPLLVGGTLNNLIPAAVEAGATQAEASAAVGVFAAFANIIGIVLLVMGILHLLSGIGTFARRSWARYLGLIVATLMFLLILLGLVGTFTAASTPGGVQPDITSLIIPVLVLVAYGFTVIALGRGGRYFERRSA